MTTMRGAALAVPRIECLERLPDWEWDAEASRWRQGMAAARRYVGRHGSLSELRRHTREGDFSLGDWMQRCREDYRAGALAAARAAEVQ